MSESEKHRTLVDFLRRKIKEDYGTDKALTVFVDLDNRKDDPAPQKINGNVPDLYATELSSELEIIGEAKTAKDFETQRSISQIENFVDYVSKREQSIFCLCVPWHIEILAEDVVLDMAQKKGLPKERIKIIGMM